MNNKLIVSPSPHVHSGDSIEKNMYGVLIALMPAFLVALYLFRIDALKITALSILFCVVSEYLIARFIRRGTFGSRWICHYHRCIAGFQCAFQFTGMDPALGALFSIGVVKMSFGD